MTQNRFKTALSEGRPQIGLWTTLSTAFATEVVAGAGFDWLCLDTEHSPGDPLTILPQLQCVAGYPGVSAMVRPAANDAVLIKRMLDAGAQTLLIPMVNSADDARAAFQRNEALIRRLARVDAFSEGTAPKGAITLPAPGATFAIPLAGIIDVAEEKSRLQKSMDKLAKEIAGLMGRLNNPNFAASAPEDAVIEAQTNPAARKDEQAKLQAALTRLAELG